MTVHKAEGLTVRASWTRSKGNKHHGSVLVHGAGLDMAGHYVVTSRHVGQMQFFVGLDQVEDLGGASRYAGAAAGHDLTGRAGRCKRWRSS